MGRCSGLEQVAIAFSLTEHDSRQFTANGYNSEHITTASGASGFFGSTHEGRASYPQRKAGWFKESTPNTSHHVAQDGSSLPSSAPRSTIWACSSTTSFDQHSY